MKELVEFMAKSLVDNPDAVIVNEVEWRAIYNTEINSSTRRYG